MGFGAPMSQWLRSDFGHAVRSSVLGSGLMRRGFFNVGYIEELFDGHLSGHADYGLYIWTLYNVTAWYDFWVDRKLTVAH
jgi:asparagine synthase (glutamine-hydrolysing)